MVLYKTKKMESGNVEAYAFVGAAQSFAAEGYLWAAAYLPPLAMLLSTGSIAAVDSLAFCRMHPCQG